MTSTGRDCFRLRLLAIILVTVAVAIIPFAWLQNVRPLTPAGAAALVVLLVAVFLSDVMAVSTPGGGAISLSYPLIVAAVIYLGPGYGAVVALAACAPILLERPLPSWERVAFNAGQLTLAAMVSGLAYVALGGRLLEIPPAPGALALGRMLPGLAAVPILCMFINMALVALGRHVLYGESPKGTWKHFSSMFGSQVVLGFVGIAIAEIIATMGVAGFALFVVPLLVARDTYRQSVGLREAYADTISSLVAALEAKDMYTKGHSERVAEYSVMIARAMDFSDDAVLRVEYAALLHDVGKVGVSHRVLAKPSSLTDAEFDEIKRHPEIAAHILADVPYLADLVPIVAAHHERLDGLGYASGLKADEVPLQARILAVADSYDAMTSARPYRDAMSHEAAVAELQRGIGSQFDGRVVEAFQQALQDRVPAGASASGVLEAQLET